MQHLLRRFSRFCCTDANKDAPYLPNYFNWQMLSFTLLKKKKQKKIAWQHMSR